MDVHVGKVVPLLPSLTTSSMELSVAKVEWKVHVKTVQTVTNPAKVPTPTQQGHTHMQVKKRARGEHNFSTLLCHCPVSA